MADEQHSEEVGRWTAKRRAGLVLSLLKGETTAADAPSSPFLCRLRRQYTRRTRDYGCTRRSSLPCTRAKRNHRALFHRLKEECVWQPTSAISPKPELLLPSGLTDRRKRPHHDRRIVESGDVSAADRLLIYACCLESDRSTALFYLAAILRRDVPV